MCTRGWAESNSKLCNSTLRQLDFRFITVRLETIALRWPFLLAYYLSPLHVEVDGEGPSFSDTVTGASFSRPKNKRHLERMPGWPWPSMLAPFEGGGDVSER